MQAGRRPPAEPGRLCLTWPSVQAGLLVAWSRWARWMPTGPGWAWGWRRDALCFTGKEFGQACQAGWDNPGRMRWGFAAERQGLSGLLTDPCVWEIRESSGQAWRIWVGWSDSLSSPSAGAYYPAQGVQQFSAGVPTAQVIVSQQPPIPPKRERKTVRSHLPPGMGVLMCRRACSCAGGGWCQPQVPVVCGMGCGAACQGKGVAQDCVPID